MRYGTAVVIITILAVAASDHWCDPDAKQAEVVYDSFAMEDRIKQFETLVEKSTYTIEDLYKDGRTLLNGSDVQDVHVRDETLCLMLLQPDSLHQTIGNILSKALKDIHEVFRPATEGERTLAGPFGLTDRKVVDGFGLFPRDSEEALIDAVENAYKGFAQHTDYHEPCTLIGVDKDGNWCL
jgi:hypothetical protein